MKTKKSIIILSLLLGCALWAANLSAKSSAQVKQQPVDGPQPAVCYVQVPYTNTTGQPQTFEVNATDACEGMNSKLLVNGALWSMVPDMGSIHICPLTLAPGDTIELKCKGVGGGHCDLDMNLSSSCP